MVNLNDGYLYSRMQANHTEGDALPLGQQVGDMRVKFQYVACGEVNVMAQQMQDEKGRYTFRQWNPSKIDAPWGEDNGSETDVHCPLCCICCFAVEKFMKETFQEVIDRVDLHSSCGPKKMMDEYQAESDKITLILRIVCWILNFFGHLLLFSPIIAVLNWIPLVGWLLGAVV